MIVRVGQEAQEDTCRVEIIRREDYPDLELDAKVELIRSVPLDARGGVARREVTALAGERYARKDVWSAGAVMAAIPGRSLAGQRVAIRVPRIRHVAGSELPLRSYEALHGDRAVNDVLLKRVLYGISCRNYEAAGEAIPGAIGLSGSTVSRGFDPGQRGAAPGVPLGPGLEDARGHRGGRHQTFAACHAGSRWASRFLGQKRFGFVETDTENAQVLTPFRGLVERGLDVHRACW